MSFHAGEHLSMYIELSQLFNIRSFIKSAQYKLSVPRHLQVGINYKKIMFKPSSESVARHTKGNKLECSACLIVTAGVN